MQGGINVEAVQREIERMREWLRRQQHNEEVRVRELWWAAERKSRDATTPEQRKAVAIEKATIKRLYRKELARALDKWNQAKAEQRAYFAGKRHKCLHA